MKAFQNPHINSHFLQPWMRVPVIPHPHQYFYLVLLCDTFDFSHSLMNTWFESLFIGLMAFLYHSLWSAFISLGLFVLPRGDSKLEWMVILHIFDICSLENSNPVQIHNKYLPCFFLILKNKSQLIFLVERQVSLYNDICLQCVALENDRYENCCMTEW